MTRKPKNMKEALARIAELEKELDECMAPVFQELIESIHEMRMDLEGNISQAVDDAQRRIRQVCDSAGINVDGQGDAQRRAPGDALLKDGVE